MAKVQEVVDADGSLVRRKPVVGDLRWDGTSWKRWSGRRWTRAAYSLHPDRLRDPAPLHREPPVGEDRRRQALARAVEDQVTFNAATVVLDGPSRAVLAWRRRVPHLFHAFATLITAGLWAVIWIADVLGRREDRVLLEVDDWGNVWAQRVRSA